MRPSEVLDRHRDEIKALLARYPVTNPRIFGSVADGSDGEGSDLDILVDALPKATLFDLGGLHSELEDLLGIRVDLVTPREIHAEIRGRVLESARPL